MKVQQGDLCEIYVPLKGDIELHLCLITNVKGGIMRCLHSMQGPIGMFPKVQVNRIIEPADERTWLEFNNKQGKEPRNGN